MSDLSEQRRTYTDWQVLAFIISLCFICGLLLAFVAYILSVPQQEAKEFDQSKQMLIATGILNYQGYFQIPQEEGQPLPAQFDQQQKILIPIENAKKIPKATDDQIKEISDLRIRPLLVDKEGEIYTLDEKNISLPEYLAENKKGGYAALPFKLLYAILPNESKSEKISAEDLAKNLDQVEAYVFPVSGFGLWAPIYGYIAIKPNGNDVIGTTWYEQAETPGLGANISEAWWQKQFGGKQIFQQSSSAQPDLQSASIGIIVVKGEVSNVFGSSPRAKSAVDGISGATLTGDGVTKAYRDSLSPYRAFFIKINQETQEETKNGD